MTHQHGIHRLTVIALAGAGFLLAALPATSSAISRRVEIRVTPGATGPIRLHVRAQKGASVRAKLNGHDLGPFEPWHNGHRSLHVSPTFGLHFGTNVLQLRRRNPGERRSQHFTIPFRVPRTHPLAAAGYDRTVTVGEPITLDGTKSLSHLGGRAAGASAAARSHARLRFRWRVIRAPRGSRVGRPTRAHKAGAAIPLVLASAADVDNADSSTAELVPDVPGTYKTELAVTGPGGQTGIDQADVNVVNPPMVPIETMAQFQGRPSPAPPPPPAAATPPEPVNPTSTTPQSTTTSTTDQGTTTTTTTAPTNTTATTPTTPTTTAQGPLGAPTPPPPTTSCRFETTDAGIPDGTPGVRIGSTFCPGDSTSWLQVVVLDRKTLQPQLNTSYSDPSKVADVQHDLAQYDSSSLVIAVSQPPNLGAPCPSCAEWQVQPAAKVNDALARIGVQAPEPSNPYPPFLRGRFSAIGVPTYPASDAYVNAPKDLADNRLNGAISGNLIVDNNLNYTLLPPRVAFNTQDAGSGLGQNVVRVGGDTYTAPLPLDANQGGQGGFQVVVLDRTGLGTAATGNNRSGNSYTCPALTDAPPPNSGPCYWFPTGLQNYDSGEAGRLNAMAAYLAKANAGDNVVIITSRGNPAIQGAGQESQWGNVGDAAKGLVDQIEALGGTRTEAYQALAAPPTNPPKAGVPYTLIGSSGAGAAQGTETQGPRVVGKAALNTVPLAGAFEPGHDYRYGVTETAPSPLAVQGTDVVSGDSVHVAGEKLRETLVQAPQPWPDLNPAAIAYIEGKLYNAEDLKAGRTIRTDYWNPPSAISDASWQDTRTKIDAVAWPGGQPGFSAKELSDAEGEFHSEITWLINVRGFTRALAQPFTDSGLTVWADQNGIGTAISGLVQPAQDNVVSSVASKILIGVAEVGAEVAAAIPGVGAGVEAVAAGVFSLITVYDLVLEVTDVAADKSADEPFSVHASEVASHLQDTLKTAQATLTNQFTNAIVADYGKLKAIGQCVGGTSVDCPDSSATWSFSDKDRVAATNAVRIGASIETYTDLLPAQYQLYQLGQTCPGSTNEKCWEGNFQGDGFYSQAVLAHVCPFLTEPNSAKLVRPFRRDIPFYRNNQGFNGDAPTDTWQAYALGTLKGGPSEGKVWTMDLVSSDYLATGRKQLPGLFAPLDPGGDFNKGGLGAQPEEVFLRAFPNPILMATAGSPHAPGQEVQPFPVRESQGPFWGGRDTHCVAQP